MKTMLRATCTILVTVSMVALAFADTSIPDASSLASISVNIGSKTYSGDEARKYLFTRVQTQENTRITTDAKVQFLQTFNIKLSKVAGNYEKRGGKASEIAKVLRAISGDIQSEIVKLSGVSGNSTTIQTSSTNGTETASYKGNAYKKDGFISTAGIKVIGNQPEIKDFKAVVQKIIDTGKISFSEAYGMEKFSPLANKGTDIDNITYHRSIASVNGSSPLKYISIAYNTEGNVLLTETYSNKNQIVFSTYSSNPDLFGKVSVIGGKINGTPFGMYFNFSNASMSGVKVTDRIIQLDYMYVPENTSVNTTPDTTRVSSVAGIETVYYKGYPYNNNTTINPVNSLVPFVHAWIGLEGKIPEIKEEMTSFYSSSFNVNAIFASSKSNADDLAFHRYYASGKGQLTLTAVDVKINKDSSLAITETYGKNDGNNVLKINIIGQVSSVYGGKVDGAAFKADAQKAVSASNRSEPGYDVINRNIDFYHPN